MHEKDEVLKIIKILTRRGVKVGVRNVMLWGGFCYSERQMHRILKHLRDEGYLPDESSPEEDAVLRIIRTLNRRGVRACISNIMAWGRFGYSERKLYRIMKRLRDDGTVVKQSLEIGYVAV